ncbi:MAG: TonB-dependent receptor [Polyangiaceae bacterium]
MNRRRLRSTSRLLVSMFAFATTLAPFAPREARADDAAADEADLQFQLGAERYKEADFRGALEHFLASNRLVANRNVIFNIARTYEQLNRAADAYRYYMMALDAEPKPDARKPIEEAIQRISANVAVLRVETDPPSATLYLNRKDLGPRGTSPRPLGLVAGKYKVIAELPGYETAESEDVDVKVGGEVKVSLKLKPILGVLRVEGLAAGAKVRLDVEDAAPLGTIPFVTPVSPGRHTLFVQKDGFQASELTVDVPARGEVAVRPQLVALTGNVVVNADVRDALISVDGQPRGFTPSVLNIPVGTHTVRITQSGFKTEEQTIVVKPNEQAKVEVVLTQLEEVTAASRTSESVEDAPASVSIITQGELRAMGYPTIADAVRGIRGVFLSDDRSYASVGFRGFGRPGDYGNRVLVTIDGQPTNDNYIWSSYVGYDGRVDIDDVERIEVVRGPGSVLYGTGAFFGVINLVTRNRNAPTHGEVAVGAAEHGVGRARATAQVRFSPEAGFWASAAAAHSSGRDFFFPEYASDPSDPVAPRDANGRPTDGNARGLDGFDAATVSGRGWYKDLTLQWMVTSRKKTLPHAEYDTVFGDSRFHFVDTRAMSELRWEPSVGKNVKLLTRVHGNYYQFDGLSPYRPIDGGPATETYKGLWGGLEQRVVWTPSNVLRLTLGGEAIYHAMTKQFGADDARFLPTTDPGYAASYLSRDDPFTVLAGYAVGDIQPSAKTKISAGARADYYSTFGLSLNPRLAFIVKPYAEGNVKLLFGKAFRAPSVYELYYVAATQVATDDPRPGVGKKLLPEEIYSGEVEFTHRFSPTLTATAAAYGNYVTNLVVLSDIPDPNDATATLNQYQNSPSNIVTAGGELEVRREWREGWMAGATYSFQRSTYVGSGAAGLREVPNSPEHMASVRGAVPIVARLVVLSTRVSFEGPRWDRYDRVSDVEAQQRTDPGVNWDLVLSGEAERLRVRYNLGLYNLMDYRYATPVSREFRQRSIVQAGRTVLATVQLSF